MIAILGAPVVRILIDGIAQNRRPSLEAVMQCESEFTNIFGYDHISNTSMVRVFMLPYEMTIKRNGCLLMKGNEVVQIQISVVDQCRKT